MAPSRLGWVQGVVAGQTAAEVAQLGDACVARRQYRHAIDAYRHASSLIPLGTQANGMYAADIHVGVGNAFLGWAELAASEGGSAEQVSQMQEQAAREFSEAVAINQRHYPAQYNLGTLLYSLGEVEAAESHLLSAVTWNHQFVEARVNLAVVYAEQGEGAAAKAELRQALKFSPKHVAAHVNMALLLLGRVIVEEDPSTTCRVALGHLRRAAELSPQSGEIQHCLAAALLHVALRHDATDNRHRGGHVLVAPPVLEKAALVGGPRERFVRTVAAEVGTEVTSRRELLAEALVHYRRAAIVQESSQHSSRPSPFASVLAVEGLFTAASHLAHSIKLETWMRDPRSATRRASVQVGLGAVQAALGRTTLAEGRYQEALRICPDHPDALFGLACVASGRTRLRHLRSLLRVEPTHPHAARMLGQCRRLVLVGADDLGLPERANRFDTYVTVWWNGEKLGSTRTKRRTVAPRWGDGFVLTGAPCGRKANQLRLEVHNRANNNRLLGGVDLEVRGGDVISTRQSRSGTVAAATVSGDESAGEQPSSAPEKNVMIKRRLTIVGATELRSRGLGKADPFAVVYWNQRRVGETQVERSTATPEWNAEVALDVVLRKHNTLRVEVHDKRRRGESIFMGQVELEGLGFVRLQVPSNGLCRDFALTQSQLPHRGRVKNLKGLLRLSSPDSATCNYSGSVDRRLRCFEQTGLHEGCVSSGGTHVDALMRPSCPPIALRPNETYPLAYPEGITAARAPRGELTIRVEEEPVMVAAYVVLRRAVCREQFAATSPTSCTLDTGQIIGVSEQRRLESGGMRVKCPSGWVSEISPSGSQCLELLDPADERYQQHVKEQDSAGDDDQTFTYGITVYTGDVRYAGTDANVFIRMFGSEGDSGSQRLQSKSRLRNLFERDQTDEFSTTLEQDLGALHKVRVCTDGRGIGAGWYLGSISIRQPDGNTVHFPCNQWFDIKQGDGLLERDLEAAKGIEQTEVPSPLTEWTVEEVMTFVSEQAGLRKEAPNFGAQDVDGLTLSTIDDQRLMELGLGRLQRAKFWRAFAQLPRASSDEPGVAAGGVTVPPQIEEPQLLESGDPASDAETSSNVETDDAETSNGVGGTHESAGLERCASERGELELATTTPDGRGDCFHDSAGQQASAPDGVLEGLTQLFFERHGRHPTENEVQEWVDTMNAGESEQSHSVASPASASAAGRPQRQWAKALFGACAGCSRASGGGRMRVFPAHDRASTYEVGLEKRGSISEEPTADGTNEEEGGLQIATSTGTVATHEVADAEPEAAEPLATAEPESVGPRSTQLLAKEISLRWDGTFHFKVASPEELVRLNSTRLARRSAQLAEKAAADEQRERVRVREETRRIERTFQQLNPDRKGLVAPTQLHSRLRFATGATLNDDDIERALAELGKAVLTVQRARWLDARRKEQAEPDGEQGGGGKKEEVVDEATLEEEFQEFLAVEGRDTIEQGIKLESFKQWWLSSASAPGSVAEVVKAACAPRKSIARQVIDSCKLPFERYEFGLEGGTHL